MRIRDLLKPADIGSIPIDSSGITRRQVGESLMKLYPPTIKQELTDRQIDQIRQRNLREQRERRK